MLEAIGTAGGRSRFIQIMFEMKEILLPEKIRERFYQHGGIFCYIILSSPKVVKNANREQKSCISEVNRLDVFLPEPNIEEGKCSKNISHFMYEMEHGGGMKGNPEEFLNYKIEFASIHVKH